MKEVIEGKGVVAGYTFKQIAKGNNGYIYQQLDGDRLVAFEVIKGHRYPTTSEWGVKAKTVKDARRAAQMFDNIERFNSFEKPSENDIYDA